MESPFIYNKYVTGKNFIGRKGDITILGNLMNAGENVSIYEPPRSGKTSAIQQAFFNMRIQGKRFAIAEVNLTATRSIGQLLLQLGDACIRAFASTPGEFADIAGRLLDLAVRDMRAKGISPLYLVTEHTGFYERYGWAFLCTAHEEGNGHETRVYIHR